MGVCFLMESCEKTANLLVAVKRLLKNKLFKYSKNDICCLEKQEVEKENLEILEDLEDIRLKLIQANTEFNIHTNSDLIESAIYNLESLETKYNYLIKQARKRKIQCDAKLLCVTN